MSGSDGKIFANNSCATIVHPEQFNGHLYLIQYKRVNTKLFPNVLSQKRWIAGKCIYLIRELFNVNIPSHDNLGINQAISDSNIVRCT